MSFEIPTVTDLRDRFVSQYKARLGGAVSILSIATVQVLGFVFAQAIHDFYLFQQQLLNQVTPFKATGIFLRWWGAVYGIAYKSASFAIGNVTLEGDSNSPVPKGAVLRNDAGAEFETLNAGVANEPIAVKARIAGIGGNEAAGSSLQLVNPLTGITGASTVDGLAGGAEDETDERYRGRILFRIQNPARGGNDADYVIWATSRPGVTRAWTLPLFIGKGSVGVAVINDDAEDRNPGPPVIDDVQQYIGIFPSQPGVAPVTANALVFVPRRRAFGFTVGLSPRTPEVEAAVIAQMKDVFERGLRPGRTIPLSHIDEAISIAAGEDDHAIRGINDSVLIPDRDEIAELGNVVFEDL